MLTFTCPDCNKDVLEEVETATVSRILLIDEDDGSLDYGDTETDFGSEGIRKYQCRFCGYVLQNELEDNLQTLEEVKEWLRDHQSQE